MEDRNQQPNQRPNQQTHLDQLVNASVSIIEVVNDELHLKLEHLTDHAVLAREEQRKQKELLKSVLTKLLNQDHSLDVIRSMLQNNSRRRKPKKASGARTLILTRSKRIQKSRALPKA